MVEFTGVCNVAAPRNILQIKDVEVE